MRVKCIYNTGKALIRYPQLGRSERTEYNQLEIAEEYLVMGMILGENELSYLIDSGGHPFACPYQLFEVIDSKIPTSWYFKAYTLEDKIYPYIQAVWGYNELCFNDNHYEDMVSKRTEEAQRLYFRRKIELEKELQKDL